VKRLSMKNLRDDYELFMKNFEEEPSLSLQYFHPFQCPVAVAEALVKEHHIQDYSVFSILLLRLIKAGFSKIEQMVYFSGMSAETVTAFFNRALADNQCKYIDPEDPSRGVMLAELGEETLNENEQGNEDMSAKAHVMYDMPRMMHIEAVTGTVIPSYMERKTIDSKPDETLGDFILPRETVEMDEELNREIKARIDEYISSDYIKSGDVINDFESITSKKMLFRWAYLAKFEGMKYPMIIMTGRKKVDNVNAKSQKEGRFDFLAMPVAISRTDSLYLEQNGIGFENVLIREDEYFEYLVEKTQDFEFTHPNDYKVEEETTIPNDEKAQESPSNDNGEVVSGEGEE